MTFITITQYFNKLQSALYLLLIVPLLVFIALYVYMSGRPADPREAYYIIIPSVVLLDWMVARILFNKKIKSARKAQGLGAKLDKYFKLTIVRFTFLSLGSLLLAGGLYLSGSDVFSALYLVMLVLSGVHWPSAAKVSRDLQLKGDERQMVYFKKDYL
jgi:hypothetical protein